MFRCSAYLANFDVFIDYNVGLGVLRKPYGLGLLACFNSEFSEIMDLYRRFVGLLGWAIGRSQSLYRPRATQTQNEREHNPCS
jgi:hypothetical protein